MALTNPPFVINHGQENTWEVRRLVASGTTASIDRGTPTKKSSTNVAICVDADGTTSQLITGISKDASTETSSAAGSVNIWLPIPGVEYRGAAKTSTLANTQALIDALLGKRVVFDLTGSVWSVDTAAADATTNGLYITGGNPLDSSILFLLSPAVTIANPTT